MFTATLIIIVILQRGKLKLIEIIFLISKTLMPGLLPRTRNQIFNIFTPSLYFKYLLKYHFIRKDPFNQVTWIVLPLGSVLFACLIFFTSILSPMHYIFPDLLSALPRQNTSFVSLGTLFLYPPCLNISQTDVKSCGAESVGEIGLIWVK